MNNTPVDRMKSINSKIKRLRLERNYTQDYLALKLNISQNAYSKLELGHSKLSLERLMQIAEVLEVDITIFFNEQD